jgi:hypothetical protein
MKNLKLMLIGMITMTMTLSCMSQTSFNDDVLKDYTVQTTGDYLTIYGNILNDNIKKDRVDIKLYQQDEQSLKWQLIEQMESNNYRFLLDRNSEYQIVFMNESDIKLIYIQAGYSGGFVYRVDANFTSNESICMYPDPDDSESFFVEYGSYENITSQINK